MQWCIERCAAVDVVARSRRCSRSWTHPCQHAKLIARERLDSNQLQQARGSIRWGEVRMESWRNRKTLILSRSDMIGLLAPADYNNCVEQAYRMHGEGRFYMDPKGHIVLDKYPGEWEAMPSYIEEPEAAACKWVSIRERNRERYDLPTVFSILIYTHPETGFPLAICDGSYHTVMRTGASAAVSAKWLARKNAKKLAIVGAGHMAEGTLGTCDTVFAWDEVRIWSRSQSTLDEFVKSQAPKYPHFPIPRFAHPRGGGARRRRRGHGPAGARAAGQG